MTLHEVSSQLNSLAIGGYFNRQKNPSGWLERYLSAMFRDNAKSVIMEIALPDGWWFFKVIRYADNGYDYFIPASRKQEARIKAELFH